MQIASRASNIEMSMLVSDFMVIKILKGISMECMECLNKGTKKKKKEWILCVLIMIIYKNFLIYKNTISTNKEKSSNYRLKLIKSQHLPFLEEAKSYCNSNLKVKGHCSQ